MLISGGRIATGEGVLRADIGIRGDKIAEIGDLAAASAAQQIDAANLIVIPGLIDTQVHFREPGLEYKEDLESGTRAALHGGVTSVLEMPNTKPPTISAEALEDKIRRASGRAWCHFGFFVGASPENAGHLGELEALPGTPGIKIFMGSSTGSLLVAEEQDLRNVLSHGRKRVAVHAEDEGRNRERRKLMGDHPSVKDHPFFRDAESARLATRRLLALSEETGRAVHILHISTADELPLIEQAKKSGLRTTAEVTPQHLAFEAPDCYERLGSLVQMNPPIRSAEHRRALIGALQAGLFDVFGSDHAPHTREEKAKPYPESPSGMPGVETMLPVLLTFVNCGLFDLPTLVRMACEKPAELYGIQGKGHLAPGYDADIVLVNPEKRQCPQTLQTKCGWTPYRDDILVGWPEIVILAGRVAIRNGERVSEPRGKMLRFTRTED